jgi:hypothetical protein
MGRIARDRPDAAPGILRLAVPNALAQAFDFGDDDGLRIPVDRDHRFRLIAIIQFVRS